MATAYPGAPAICCIRCSRVIYRDGSFIQDQRSQDESYWVVVGDSEGVMVLKDPMKSCVDKFFSFLQVSVYGQHVRWWPLPPRKYPCFEHGWFVGRGCGLRVEGALGFMGLLKVNFKRYDSSRCDLVLLP